MPELAVWIGEKDLKQADAADNDTVLGRFLGILANDIDKC